MKALLVDDQPENHIQLRSLLKDCCSDINVIADAGSVEEAVALVKEHQPDIVFLDIELQDGTGFDVLEKAGDYNFLVVFVTAFEKYAVRAFRINAIDYLLKPVARQELAITCEKIIHWAATIKENTEIRKTYKRALQYAATQASEEQPAKQLVITSHRGLEMVSVEDIRYIEADNTYSRLYLSAGRQLTASKPLLEYEELLETETFYRVHRSYILNMNYIDKVVPRESTAILKDGKEIPVSRRKMSDFSEFVKRYTG